MKIYNPRLLFTDLLAKIELSANPIPMKKTNLGVPIKLNFAILSTGFMPK